MVWMFDATINKPPAFSPMDTDDLLNFAKYLGFEGLDGDLFYESYYQLDNEDYEYEDEPPYVC